MGKKSKSKKTKKIIGGEQATNSPSIPTEKFGSFNVTAQTTPKTKGENPGRKDATFSKNTSLTELRSLVGLEFCFVPILTLEMCRSVCGVFRCTRSASKPIL